MGLTAIAFFRGWIWPGPLAERERSRADVATTALLAERKQYAKLVPVLRTLLKEVRELKAAKSP